MSKAVKKMQMDALKATFKDVRDMVVLSTKGLPAQSEFLLRREMRKKNIRLQMVKNSFTRKVFGEIGMSVPDNSAYWAGPTILAWGAGSLAELSQALDELLKNPKTAALFKDKVQFKGAISEGSPISFDQALKMPTRQEAIGRVISLALAPAARLASQIAGPGATVCGQIKSRSEEKSAGEAAA